MGVKRSNSLVCVVQYIRFTNELKVLAENRQDHLLYDEITE